MQKVGHFLLIAALCASCQKKPEDAPGGGASARKGGGTSAPPQSAEELKTPLAKIDDVTITLGEFQERINRQSPYIRARYTSLEQKKEFLDSLVRFEVLAAVAAAGWRRLPDGRYATQPPARTALLGVVSRATESG